MVPFYLYFDSGRIDMDMFTDVLLNAGPIGLLAAYMMWWLQKQEAKHDKLTSHYMMKIEDLQSKDEGSREAMQVKYEKREDALRDRYDHVIIKLDEERKQHDINTAKSLEKAIDKLEQMNTRVDALGARFDDLSTKIINTNQKLVMLEQQVQRMDGILEGIKTALNTRS
jgi:chromosome segregation ATPase